MSPTAALLALALAGLPGSAPPVGAERESEEPDGSAKRAEELPAVAVLAVPLPDPAAGDPFVPVLVEIAGPVLLAAPPAGVAEGEIRVRALDDAGAVVDAFDQPFSLAPRNEEGDPLAETGLKLFGVLRLPPGDYRLEAEVFDAQGEPVGHAVVSLPVPRFGAGEAGLSPPLFPEAFERWRVFRQSQSPYDLAFPFLGVGGGAFMPSAAPVLPMEGPVVFHLLAHNVGELGEELDVRLLDGEGVAVPATAQLEARDDGELPGQSRLRVTLDASPPRPDAYRLEIAVPGLPRALALSVRFVADPGPARATAPESLPEPPADPLEDVVHLAGDLDPAALAGRYREALALYAAGSFEEATARLQLLETEATAGGHRGQVRALRELQIEVIRELLGRGSSLLPVLHLHALAGIAYRDGNHFWLMAQSHLFLRELVRGWISLEESEEARRLGALALVASGSAGPALEVDPANPLALLLRAREEERLGHLEAAAARLERLLAVLPEDPHARLRLGLILKRLGRTVEASELLAAVTAGEAPGWIASVAVQELARLELQAGRGARAEALLRRGVGELGDQTLYLQLAHFLDRNLRQAEAVALLSRMPLAGAGSPTAPRHRYSSAPEEEIGAAREELAEEARSRLPSLQAALEEGSTPPEEST